MKNYYLPKIVKDKIMKLSIFIIFSFLKFEIKIYLKVKINLLF